VHWRWSCPKFLRETFHEWSAQTIQVCDWAAAYNKVQRDKGKSHHAAVRALAYKWIHIAFRCWKDHKPYDDARYETALRRCNLPVRKPVPHEVPVAWISCGSFKRLALKNAEKPIKAI
jgi:hypothetical protein